MSIGPGYYRLSSMRLEEAKFKAVTMDDTEVSATLGRASRCGVYDETTLLGITSRRSDAIREEAARKVVIGL